MFDHTDNRFGKHLGSIDRGNREVSAKNTQFRARHNGYPDAAVPEMVTHPCILLMKVRGDAAGLDLPDDIEQQVLVFGVRPDFRHS
jgi:hypothetical protein